MKRTFLLSLVAVGMTLMSCQKSPDTDMLTNDYLVYTNYDTGTDFKAIKTFHVIDSILIIGNDEKASYWKNNNSQKIVNAYRAGLEGAGYTPAAEEEMADIVLQLSYINTTYYYNTYGSVVELLSGILELGRMGLVLSIFVHLQLQHRFYHRRACEHRCSHCAERQAYCNMELIYLRNT